MGLFDRFGRIWRMFQPECFVPPPPELLKARESHYVRHFGALNQPVMHSTDFKPMHVDIYQFAPTNERPFWTLITGGMSDARQIRPDDCAEHMSPRAEILMYVPEPQNWMFSVLKGLAEMPFDRNTYLHWWHTVPNGFPMTAQPSLLTSFFFLPPYHESADFGELTLEGDRVDFLWLVPITEAERAFAVEHGSRELEMLMENAELSHVLDESRSSVV
jgi:hypothetical protein